MSLVNDAGFEFPLRSVGTRGKYDVRSKSKRVCDFSKNKFYLPLGNR